MKSLCTSPQQKAHIDKLISLASSKALSIGETWTAFSAPGQTKSFKRKGYPDHKVAFSAAEVATYKDVREAVHKKLFQKCLGLCSYCRRPVGHYGWAWHIEHVLPKAKYPAHAFELANLTVGCVHCNHWKGARIDKKVLNKVLPIINPVEDNFKYSDHLHYVQVGTESFAFAKYSPHSPEGIKTYEELMFSELERAHTINGLHAITADLHERLTRVMHEGSLNEDGRELVTLLAELKSSIYR